MGDTFLLLDGQTYVFVGDSLTQDGEGYSMLVPKMVKLRYPERNIKFINAGIGGNTSLDMRARFETDALKHKPGWVSITAGSNDAWRLVSNPAEGIDLEKYSGAVKEMTEKTIESGVFPVLISPPPFEAHFGDGADKVNKMLEKYTDWMKKYAEKNHLLYVPMMETFLSVSKAVCRREPDFKLTEEGVHMNFQGRLLMAVTLLRYLGFSWENF